jgi:hypothetical protein
VRRFGWPRAAGLEHLEGLKADFSLAFDAV